MLLRGLLWEGEVEVSLVEGGDFGSGGGGKGEEGGTYWVVVAKAETKTVCLVEVEGVAVEDSDVHLPFCEVGSGD